MTTDRRARFRSLFDRRPVIAPSMLKCDFTHLAEEVRALETAGARVLHWDVMDGHFVPNLSYGALLFEGLRKQTELCFDAHLMMAEPERYLEDYVRAGCDCITVHIEAVPDPRTLVERIHEAGVAAGVALNPGTPVTALEAVLPHCDQVLVMSVEPGFGGQKFMPEVLEKVRRFQDMIKPGTLLAIDGGIGPATIADAAKAGAGYFVTGSALFDHADYGPAMGELERLAAPHLVSPPLE